MGEIADAIIEGEMCQECGVYIGSATGFPRSCATCARAAGKPHPLAAKVNCPDCGRKVKAIGLQQHRADVHAVGKTEVQK